MLVKLLEHQENLIIGVLFAEEGKSLRNGLVKAVEPIETVGVGAVGLQVDHQTTKYYRLVANHSDVQLDYIGKEWVNDLKKGKKRS